MFSVLHDFLKQNKKEGEGSFLFFVFQNGSSVHFLSDIFLNLASEGLLFISFFIYFFFFLGGGTVFCTDLNVKDLCVTSCKFRA